MFYCHFMQNIKYDFVRLNINKIIKAVGLYFALMKVNLIHYVFVCFSTAVPFHLKKFYLILGFVELHTLISTTVQKYHQNWMFAIKLNRKSLYQEDIIQYTYKPNRLNFNLCIQDYYTLYISTTVSWLTLKAIND